MTNGPNRGGGTQGSRPVGKTEIYRRGLGDVPLGKDVALTWSSRQTPEELSIHYTITNVSDADIWVLDTAGTAYTYERAGGLRLLLGRAANARAGVHDAMPKARLLKVHGALEGDLKMLIPVLEYDAVPFMQDAPAPAYETKHVERAILMLHYVLAGPDRETRPASSHPDLLDLGPGAIFDTKGAILEHPLSVDVRRRTDKFVRVNLPGELDEGFRPASPPVFYEDLPQLPPIANHPAFGDVEKYAKLMGAWRSPYLDDRVDFLARAGLTWTGFHDLRDHWCGRFASAPDAAKLRARFEPIFKAELAARAAADREEYKARMAATSTAQATSNKALPTPPTAASDTAGGAQSPSAPVVSGHDAAQVHLLPTFLQAPAPADDSRAPKGTAPSLLPTQSGPVSMGETLELDPAAILAALSGKMPFDPRRPSAASVPSAMPSKGREQSGQTLDLDPTALGALAAAAIAKGPPRGTPGAPGAATGTPAPAATPARKRLVRFDPQTGTPLATPYWEDLPSTSDASTRKR